MSNRKKVEYSGLELRIDIKPENKNRNFVRNSKNASDEIFNNGSLLFRGG
mgnify:CR=1 FL=1